jgi:hypothetical protein
LSGARRGGSVAWVDDELPIEPDDLPGGWANDMRVARQPGEFTIDFLRIDPFEPCAFLVSRIIGPSSLLVTLNETLEGLWHDYVRESMPPEARDDE